MDANYNEREEERNSLIFCNPSQLIKSQGGQLGFQMINLIRNSEVFNFHIFRKFRTKIRLNFLTNRV